MPSLGLIRGPKARRRAGGERERSREADEAPQEWGTSAEEADPYEGKSEGTVLLEMLLDEMESSLEASVAALGVPLGMQETTEEKWREWFVNEASEAQRREQMASLGTPEVLRRVYGEQVAQGVG